MLYDDDDNELYLDTNVKGMPKVQLQALAIYKIGNRLKCWQDSYTEQERNL